jgi:hypothetical protein
MCGWKNSGRDNSNFKLTGAGKSPGPKTDHTLSSANGTGVLLVFCNLILVVKNLIKTLYVFGMFLNII